MITTLILFGSFFFGILGLISYMPVVFAFFPELTTQTINMVPMYVFPVLIVIFVAFVHFIGDDAINAIGNAGDKLVKFAPYLVFLALALYVVTCVYYRDFLLLVPYYWFHNFLGIFDLILVILQIILAFLIGLFVFSIVPFSRDKYIDVTYEKSSYHGDIETHRSEAYTARLQFYLIALLSAAIGLLMAFSPLSIVAFVLFFSFFIIGKFKTQSLKGKSDIFKARDRFVRNQIIITTACTLLSVGAIAIGTVFTDYRLEKPSDILSIEVTDENSEQFLTYQVDSNTGFTYEGNHYNANIGLEIEMLNNAYVIADLQIRVEITYQMMSTENGEITDEETYADIFSLNRIGTFGFFEFVPQIGGYYLTAYIITSQSVELLHATALCRYNVTRNFPYIKVGTKDVVDIFTLDTTTYPESEQEPFLYARFLSNTYVRELHAEISLGNSLVLKLNLTNAFFLVNESIVIGAADRLYDSEELSLVYCKGFITEIFV
jgi:hypothetical protein